MGDYDEKTVGEVRAIVRDPSKVIDEGTFPETDNDQRLKIVSGDASKADTLSSSFRDCRAIFWAAAGKGYDACVAVDRDGLKEAAVEVQAKKDDANAGGLERFVLVSS